MTLNSRKSLRALSAGSFLLLLAAASPTPSPPPPGLGGEVGTFRVIVNGVRSGEGEVEVALCPQDLFLKECPLSARAPANPGTTIVTFRGVPNGRYAAQAYHDANANKRVDRKLFGIPKEGVGFSNDAKITLGPPKFASAAFDLRAGVAENIAFKLRYF